VKRRRLGSPSQASRTTSMLAQSAAFIVRSLADRLPHSQVTPRV
jgi:hypothetical protein